MKLGAREQTSPRCQGASGSRMCTGVSPVPFLSRMPGSVQRRSPCPTEDTARDGEPPPKRVSARRARPSSWASVVVSSGAADRRRGGRRPPSDAGSKRHPAMTRRAGSPSVPTARRCHRAHRSKPAPRPRPRAPGLVEQSRHPHRQWESHLAGQAQPRRASRDTPTPGCPERSPLGGTHATRRRRPRSAPPGKGLA
jgi:hypothetical protein